MELLIVVIVIAVIAAVAIPKFINASSRAQAAQDAGQIKLMLDATERFKADTGYYPGVLSDIAATSAPASGQDASGVTKSIAASSWHGPYLNSMPTPSNSAYRWALIVSPSGISITQVLFHVGTSGGTGGTSGG